MQPAYPVTTRNGGMEEDSSELFLCQTHDSPLDCRFMIEPPGLPKPTVTQLLKELGSQLEFYVKTEVEASESAFVDVVWFDKRLPIPGKYFKMRYALVLPVVGFEVERHTGLNAKHVKGSVSNLSNLGAQLGVIVIGQANLDALQKSQAWKHKEPIEVRKALADRVYRWVYAEAQPRVRIIVMFEEEVRKWAKGMRPNPSSGGAAEPFSASPAASP
jgi:hypothetical protein